MFKGFRVGTAGTEMRWRFDTDLRYALFAQAHEIHYTQVHTAVITGRGKKKVKKVSLSRCQRRGQWVYQ